MKHAASPSAHQTAPADDFGTRLRIYKDIADVTWRMFLPSIGGCVLGIVADRSFGTAPWCTVAGVSLGFITVGFLLWRQVTGMKA